MPPGAGMPTHEGKHPGQEHSCIQKCYIWPKYGQYIQLSIDKVWQLPYHEITLLCVEKYCLMYTGCLGSVGEERVSIKIGML